VRVAQFLLEREVAHETIVHPPSFTAQKRARFLHVPGHQVAKSVLLLGPAGYFVAVLPASRHVDTELLSRELGGPVRLADDREIAAVFRDCEWGVVAPFGTLYDLPTVLDQSIDPDSPLVFEGENHAVAIRMLCRDFERLERPRRLPFSRR
jgi:Ala-tRNA(Pro) deacylase